MMSCPKAGGEATIKRIIRYLKGRPRVAIRYKIQESSGNQVVFTDSDWEGCRQTGKNTSGGLILPSEVFVKLRSKTQGPVARINGEKTSMPQCHKSRQACYTFTHYSPTRLGTCHVKRKRDVTG